MTNVVIVVERGLVQNAYANSDDVNIKVLDMDMSDYPDDDEILEKEEYERELEQVKKSGEYKQLY